MTTETWAEIDKKTRERVAVFTDALLEHGYLGESIHPGGSSGGRTWGNVNGYWVDVLSAPSRRNAAEVLVEHDGRIVIFREFVPGVVDTLKKIGLASFVDDRFTERQYAKDLQRYSAHFVHKISPSANDVVPEVWLDGQTLATKASLGKSLREQKVLGKGDSIAAYRFEPNGNVVVFPRGQFMYWHSITLRPTGRG